MADNQETRSHHHHHHHHHSSRRKHFLRKVLKDSCLLGVTVTAALCVLLVMYCGMRDNPNLVSLLTLALPVFLLIGALVGVVNWFLARRSYDRSRH